MRRFLPFTLLLVMAASVLPASAAGSNHPKTNKVKKHKRIRHSS